METIYNKNEIRIRGSGAIERAYLEPFKYSGKYEVIESDSDDYTELIITT